MPSKPAVAAAAARHVVEPVHGAVDDCLLEAVGLDSVEEVALV